MCIFGKLSSAFIYKFKYYSIFWFMQKEHQNIFIEGNLKTKRRMGSIEIFFVAKKFDKKSRRKPRKYLSFKKEMIQALEKWNYKKVCKKQMQFG